MRAGAPSISTVVPSCASRRTSASPIGPCTGDTTEEPSLPTVFSPSHGPIALALVRREANPGDTVALKGSTALIVDVPFER